MPGLVLPPELRGHESRLGEPAAIFAAQAPELAALMAAPQGQP